MSACCPTCGLVAPSSQAVGLTRRQFDVLQYLEQCAAENVVSPSYDEIAFAIGCRSKSTIARHIEKLERRGYIRRTPHCRSLIVVGQPPPLRAVAPPPSPEHRHA